MVSGLIFSVITFKIFAAKVVYYFVTTKFFSHFFKDRAVLVVLVISPIGKGGVGYSIGHYLPISFTPFILESM